MSHPYRDIPPPRVQHGAGLTLAPVSRQLSVERETVVREMPAYLEIVGHIKTDWPRYFGYAFVVIFFAAHMFSCVFLPQFEEMISEAPRQRYVRT